MRINGFTLLEMLMVVVVTLLIMAAVFGLLSIVTGNAKTREAKQNINTLRVGVKNLYGNQVNFYEGVNNSIIKKANLAPEKMLSSGGLLKHVWDDKIVVKHLSGDKTSFYIEYQNVPEKPCIKLATIDNFDRITVNGDQINTVGDATNKCVSSNNIVYESH